MRRVFNSFLVAVVTVTLSISVFAAPRGERERGSQDKTPTIAKMLKKIVRALGDGLTIPHP